MGLEIGDTFVWEITGAHGVGQTGDTFSLPVKNISYRLIPDASGEKRSLMEGVNLKGSFSMNKTTAKILTTQLKSRNTDDWIGAGFSSVVTLARNPTAGGMTKSWIVDDKSITAPKKKPEVKK